MELRKCPNGHYYDTSIYQECPTCKNAGGQIGNTMGFTGAGPGSTLGNFEQPRASFGSQMNVTQPLGSGHTAPLSGMASGKTGSASVSDDVQTVALAHKELGIDPVVAWLVSLNGSERGRDYRVHSDNNFIGRSESMDICIRGDDTISRVRHAVLTYDGLEKAFYFAPGEGRSITRLNGKAVLGMVELQAYDVIQIGQSKLLFIPLCGERFEWSNEES